MRHTFTGLLLISTLTLGGCIFAPDGGWHDDTRARARQAQPTIGQELLDLDRARQANVITTAEYESAKARILNGN
ncbi:MAG TPA: hypothetical protein VNR18_01265 [Hyphomicrobiales bacterium]|nr:hypothetical protein [Hyphomicrobiales bacterium]